jgi:transcriptional regulator GlxA family with amidase domain
VLIVCGGPGWHAEVKNEQMLSFLRGQRPEALASVCTGALILAAAGVLDGRSATTRRAAAGNEDNAPLQLLRTYAHRITPREAVVVDSGIVTGGGVSLAIDTTLYLIGKFYGKDARDEVARLIEYDRAYAANCAVLGTFEIGTASSRP